MYLVLFLRRYGLFISFVVLELIAFRLIAYQPTYQNIAILSSANVVVSYIYDFSTNVQNFFTLKARNKQLIEDNGNLKTQLLLSDQKSKIYSQDSSLKLGQVAPVKLISARVINNSIHLSANYLTLNKGRYDGVRLDMGIINKGVVGKIKSTSASYSTAYSLLHPNMLVAAQVKRTKTIGVARWIRSNTYQGTLEYIPKYIDIRQGDTIVTSSYNAIFPPGIPIGTVKTVKVSPQVNFQIITFDFSEEFSSLDYVYIIKNVSDTLSSPDVAGK